MVTQFIFLDPLIDSEATVLRIREKALEHYRQRIVLMEWAGEGVSSKKAFTAKVEDVLAETRQCLKLMNPAKYGPITNSARQLRF